MQRHYLLIWSLWQVNKVFKRSRYDESVNGLGAAWYSYRLEPPTGSPWRSSYSPLVLYLVPGYSARRINSIQFEMVIITTVSICLAWVVTRVLLEPLCEEEE